MGQVNAADTVQNLEAVWVEIVSAHGDQSPSLELDAAYQNRKEQLGEQEGRRLEL
jgi:hypothetical protein